MAGEGTNRVGSTEVIQERIASIATDLAEIKGSLKCISAQQTTFEKHYIAEHQKLVSKVEEHDKDIEKLIVQMNALEKAVTPLIAAHRILVWVASAVGLSIIALIWAIVTHQITLGIP